jgi:1-deoxy-D-xylulose-5-phosphate synthase
MELLEENGLLDKIKVVRMGVSDEIVPHGDPKFLLARYGLDARGIYAKVRGTVESFEEWQQAGKKRLKVVR